MKDTLTKPRNPKEWRPTPDQVDFIREKYATYYSLNHTLTKTRLAKIMGVSIPVFERFCQRAGIKPKQPKEHSKRDFSGYIRVPVPCKMNCPTYILVPPDRDPEAAKKKYMRKHKVRMERKPWQGSKR